MQTQFDAVIVGAGPAGSAAAVLLARSGWSVALIERQRFPRRKVCGECLAASNLPLLEDLGIGPALAACAGPELRHVALLCGARQTVAEMPAAAQPQHPWGRAMGRETLDTLLLRQARVAGAQVLQPWRVQAIEGEVGHWRVEIHAMDSMEQRSLRASVAIDAHGSWEKLPWAPEGGRAAHLDSDLLAFKANFCDTRLEGGLLPLLSFVGGYGGMVVADAGVTTLACCLRRDRLDALRSAAPGSSAGEVVQAMLERECRGVRLALQGARRSGPWLAAGPIHPGIRLRGDDGIFRLGNAAGEAHPIIGEGMSMALQSAYLLCAQLLSEAPGCGVPDAQRQHQVARRYARAWRRQFAPRLRLAATFANVAMRPAAAAALMLLARAWPGLLTQGARWGGKHLCAVNPALIP